MTDEQALERAVKVMGPLEGRIMTAIWSGSVRQPFVVRNVQRLTPELAYTTLMTTLNRLAEKGILIQQRVPGQRAYEYRAAGSPSEYLAAASNEQVTKMLEQFGDAALAAFEEKLEGPPADQRERQRRAAGRD